MMGMILVSFPSCTGILDNLYDKPADEGFIEDLGNHGTLEINPQDYSQWTYIDFAQKHIEVRDIKNPGASDDGKTYGEPEIWDIALHRTDCKTNNGAILATEYTSLEELAKLDKVPAGKFIPDIPACKPEDVDNPEEKGRIIIDMSQMMDGIIKYAPSSKNLEIAPWIRKDTNEMPPVITLSGKVYLIHLENGHYLALQLVKYVSGNLTIKYHYPVDF